MGILDKYRAQYRVSIEDFADQVQAYIERQGPDFRLNFFVDEVGQYIADNVKLMTNLQTIAESLATKCRGRAWLIVTAQEEMDSVIGEMSQQQGNDFSKIQARFANRLKLTSADVAEVIRKRLLHKNETGIDLLSDVYAAEHNNFRTLFDFADGSQTYRNFRDRDALHPHLPLHPLPVRAVPVGHPEPVATTTPSRAGTARWASAPCWASFSRWRSASATTRSAGWPPSTSCSRASARR